MNDRSRHIVIFLIIALLIVGLIVGVNVWLGTYLRTAKLAKVDSVFGSVQYYETTKIKLGDVEGEGYILHYTRSESVQGIPIEETYIHNILTVADIALAVAGVFIFLIILSLEKQNVRNTLWLFGLLCAFIVITIIVINSLISHYANKSNRREERYYDSIEKVPILIFDDDQLRETGVLQNFRISGDTAA
ncbi:MAG: hypothetical protein J5607_02135 [Clostridiales bacterium]|nr:hypothetical protein [Clostridiales bacterium]